MMAINVDVDVDEDWEDRKSKIHWDSGTYWIGFDKEMHCCSWPPINIDATRHVEIKDTAEKCCGRAKIAFRAEQNPTDSCWKNGTTNDDSNATSNIQQPPANPRHRKALSMLGLDLLCHINSQVMPSCFNRFSIEGPAPLLWSSWWNLEVHPSFFMV